MNAESERAGDLLAKELQLGDSRKENPKPLIDGIVPGPDNAKHCGPAKAFMGKMEAIEI